MYTHRKTKMPTHHGGYIRMRILLGVTHTHTHLHTRTQKERDGNTDTDAGADTETDTNTPASFCSLSSVDCPCLCQRLKKQKPVSICSMSSVNCSTEKSTDGGDCAGAGFEAAKNSLKVSLPKP